MTPYDYTADPPVYPGHAVTCALVILKHYAGRLPDAWKRTDHGWLACEGEVHVPTAGGALSRGCDLIRRCLAGQPIDVSIDWADGMWKQARLGEDHPDKYAPGQEQADRVKAELREMLAAVLAERKGTGDVPEDIARGVCS